MIALDWKWLFLYPDRGVATVNFIQIPVDTPVNFEITADAPMNSFWVPQLGGQIYAMPSMKTELHLMAHETGDFRGSSANISGKGFAGMTFTVRASSEEEFLQWIKKTKKSSLHLGFEEYENLVQPGEYHPVTYYTLEDKNLFDKVLMKYMTPSRNPE